MQSAGKVFKDSAPFTYRVFLKTSEKDDAIPSSTLSNYSQITKRFTQKCKLFDHSAIFSENLIKIAITIKVKLSIALVVVN